MKQGIITSKLTEQARTGHTEQARSGHTERIYRLMAELFVIMEIYRSNYETSLVEIT